MVNDSYVPGSRPAAVWGVPHDRNPNFTGRGRFLADLREAFTGRSPGRRVRVIAGLGGIGKTQVALEYCYKHRWDYQVVWWINAEEPTNVALGYAALARAMGLNFPIETPLDEIRHVLRRVLSQRADWLIVFDNAPSLDAVRNYLPLGGKAIGSDTPAGGHVIVTSRNAEDADATAAAVAPGPVGAVVLLLPRMTRNESIAFLRKRTNRIDPNETASRLAQALGDLPLALEQASAVINEGGLSFQEYLSRFERHWAELLRRGPSAGDYPDSVAMTWEISFRAVEDESGGAASLLAFASCLGPDAVRRAFLLESHGTAPEALQPVLFSDAALDEAIRTLARYSLVEAHGDAILVHRLVAGLCRRRLTDEERAGWIEAALHRVAEGFDFQSSDTATWPSCAELLGKVMAVTRFAEAEGVAPLRVAGLLDSAGRYLLRTAQYAPARDALSRAMAVYERLLGADHPRVSAVANNLGRVLTRLGENAQARWCFERALEIDRAAYGDDDPHVATVANNYGMALHVCGQVGSAREQFAYALAVYERHYGPEHSKTASVLNNLGFVCAQLGEHEAAVEHFARALAVAETTYHPDHPVIGSILSNLGDARRRAGDSEAARDDLLRALRIDETAYGRVHPDVARDLQRLAELATLTGDPETARAYYERALSIDEQVYGPDHVLLIHRLNPLAQLLRAAGDFAESQRYFERAVQIRDGARRPEPLAAGP